MCVCVCVCVCIHITYIFIYTHTHTYIHTHTHTHTHIYIYIYIYIYILLNFNYYIRMKGRVEQSREKCSALPNISLRLQKEAFGSPSTTVANLTYFYIEERYYYDFSEFE